MRVTGFCNHASLIVITKMRNFEKCNFPAPWLKLHPVYKTGSGSPVILMHELPGMTPECLNLAERIADAGFTVYLPLMFGELGQGTSWSQTLRFSIQLCISREFKLYARNQSSPITDWLRELCQKVLDEHPGPGVGVIGMCLTGGFVLSLMADKSVIAPVASQPSLPFGFVGHFNKALGTSPHLLEGARDRAKQGVPLLALRFSEDCISPSDRFATLRREFGEPTKVIEDSESLCWRRGKTLETIEINSKPGNPYRIPSDAHSVLTFCSRDGNHPVNRVVTRVIEFLREQFSKQ